MINFKAEVENRKEEILNDLKMMIAIKSDYDESTISESAPFGEGPKKALEAFLELGNRDGFEVKNVDNYAGHIQYGNAGKVFGILGHVDVVPATDDWQPYNPRVEDGVLIGRGSQDDKGPMIAAYYAMKIIKDLNLPISNTVKMIVGTDEESKWRCVDHYFKHEPKPDFGISPDAAFPVVHAEKGFIDYSITGSFKDDVVLSFIAGEKSNMVPENAKAVIRGNHEVLFSAYEQYLKTKEVTGSMEVVDGNTVVTLVGKAAHSSLPENGKSAIHLLAQYLYNSTQSTLAGLIVKYFSNDHYGVKLGIDLQTADSGVLTTSLGIVKFENEQLEMICNVRYPNTWNSISQTKHVQEIFAQYGCQVEILKEMYPIFQDPNSDFIQTLLNSYRKNTGDELAQSQVMGGATYARVMENCVAYGMMFPKTVDRMHQKNESIVLEELYLATVIYAEAIYNLIK
ncbi:MAG: dipeptidase PepV [Culicoidibacterales bacterium]